MTDKDIQIVSVDRSAALQPYANRDEVREVFDRLMMMHPAAQKIGRNGMMAVAQLAVLLGANPLPGANELTVWEQGGRVVTNLGVNFWRRKAQEWGGIVWQIKPRPMRGEELELYDIPQGSYAAICMGVRSDEMLRWRSAGFTVNEIWDMAGVTGIGVSGKNEAAKNGRPGVWTAIKRAEIDALRRAFPVEFGAVDRTANTAADVTIVDLDIEEAHIPADTRGAAETANWEIFGVRAAREAVAEIDFVTGEIIEGDMSEIEPDRPKEADHGPLPDDEQVIAETPATAFVETAAAVLETDQDTIKDRLHALGYSKVPADQGKRLAAYRLLKTAAPEAGQDNLFNEPAAVTGNGAYQE